ncbi:MAG TPA: DUF4012 domain-containing protein [Candidatus Saccharimonadales bacterium]|nr:DUF4012 domain-containing protein [Candidatus Saccharimonadales bacterium]
MDSGFKKIDFANQKSDNTPTTGSVTIPNMRRRKLSLKRSKYFIAFIVVVALLAISSIFTVFLPLTKTVTSGQKTAAAAKLMLDAAKKQDIEQASVELVKTRASLVDTQNAVNGLGTLKFIPIASGYYSDMQHLIKAGFDGLDAASILIDSVKPYQDVLGLKGKGSFVGGTAEQRISTAVKTFSKITPRIDDIANALTKARNEIDAVDPNHYPPFFGGDKIRTNLEKGKSIIDQGVTFADEARPLIKLLPALLGEPDTKKYLVIFQNDKELRPTGGFITAYSVFRIEHGVIHVENSTDIYSLDATIPNKPKAPAPILAYLPKVPEFNLRDTNLSPDYKVSMDTFAAMYKTSPQAAKVDGIIAIDTNALVAAMNILGDITVDGETFTTKNDPHCNCPQVIYQLEQQVDQPVNYVKNNRKGIIGDLMYAIMTKAFSSSPKLYWGPLFQAMLTQTSQKHIMFYLFNQDAQKGVEALNAGGRIRDFSGDYLHINEANFGGAKSNQFVSENVDQTYSVGSDGSISKTVTIHYKNPFPPSDCNLERGGLCLNATLRDWVRVYVPKGSTLTSSSGSQVKVTTSDELGKTMFEGFLEVRPQGSASYSVTYKLPFKVASGSPLPLLIQKQPGTDANAYTTTVNGKQTDSFKLQTDYETKIKL